MRRVLVIGSQGQLGARLCAEAQTRGLTVVTMARKAPADIVCDLAKPLTASITKAIADSKPDAILIAAGYTFVDGAEATPDVAYAVNAVAPTEVAKAAVGIPVVFYSTDYVFDGHRDPYKESDTPNPQSVYGKSKLEGEKGVLAASAHNLVLRTSVVYGFDAAQKNFVYQLRKAAREGRTLKVANDQQSCPTYNASLAEATFELLDKNIGGLFHATGPEGMLRPAFGRMIGDVYGFDASAHMEEVTTQSFGQRAIRPLKACLDSSRLTQVLGHALLSPHDGLLRMREFTTQAERLATHSITQ